MKEVKAVMKPALGEIEMVKSILFIKKNLSNTKNEIISAIKFGFLIKFILTNKTFLGTNFFSETALLQVIKTLW